MGRLILIYCVALSLAAETVEYAILPGSGNRFGLEVEKTGFLRGKKHIFVYDRYRGSLRHDSANPANSKVHVSIDAKSIRCLDTWVSDKDKVKVLDVALNEMMGASQHPELTFVSHRIVPKSPNTFDVQGMLTIRGVSKPATVAVTMHSNTDWEGTAAINMKDYGLKPPSAALGTVGTREIMNVVFRLQLKPAT